MSSPQPPSFSHGAVPSSRTTDSSQGFVHDPGRLTCRHVSQVKDTRLRAVQLEGHVIMKIVKHCQECSPALVTGQLLGLDVGNTLEVTDCFPFPVSGAPVRQSESWEGTDRYLPNR